MGSQGSEKLLRVCQWNSEINSIGSEEINAIPRNESIMSQLS